MVIGRLVTTIAVALLAGLVGVSNANAAFPGRDGMLAVQPVSGGGIVLVNADGGHARRICSDSVVCGQPVRPRFSADGRAIIFSGPDLRMVGTNGSCLNCQFGRGGEPAFMPDGTLVTFVSHGGVLEDGVDGLRRATVVAPPSKGGGITDSVSSAGGELAVVRSGRVWVGRPDRLRPLSAGGSPSWAPDGGRIALARHGWIEVVRVSARRARLLVRGSAPAFSPDGRWIAFIGPKHALEVVPSTGGRARAVGHMRGVTVDWQPVPRHPGPACVSPPGSSVLSNSHRAVVTTASVAVPGALPDSAAMGCLWADGRERLLEKFTFNTIDGTTGIGLAATNGDFAALVSHDVDEHYGGFTESTSVFDLRTGQSAGYGGESDGCEGGPSCTGISRVLVGSDGVSAVYVDGGPVSPATGTDPLRALACASASLCIAGEGDYGQVDVSTDPQASPWTSYGLVALGYASCPSVTLCVATSGSRIYTSTDPKTGASSWTSSTLPGAPALGAISCPSSTLCVAVADPGRVFVSTDPTGGAGAWSAEDVDGTNSVSAISCPSSSECLAGDAQGNIIASTDPTGGASTWQLRSISSQPLDIADMSCPSISLCVAITAAGAHSSPDYLASSDPTAGAWMTVPAPAYPSALDCPSTSLCVAVGGANTVEVSTDPAADVWTSYAVNEAGGNLDDLSCPTMSFCVAAGNGGGDALVSDDPEGGAAAWTPVLADPITCPPSTACGTEQILASDRTGVHTLDTSTEFEAQTGPQLTGLTLNGDTLTWLHSGMPRTATLQP